MEDEQGAGGQGSSGGASASPLSDNLPSESLIESMGSDNQVQRSYEEGDGEEIMVEVVGSDVYVDGVGAHKEGHLESGEVGERTEGSELHNDVSNEGDVNKVKESDMGLSDSRYKKHSVVTEEVDGSFSKSVDVKGDAVSALPSRGCDAVDDEVWNPGIEAMDGSSSGDSVPSSEAAQPSPMGIVEEKRTEDEGVPKDSADLENPEHLDHPVEAVFDEKADTREKELLPSSDGSAISGHFSLQASAPNEEVLGPSPMVISEEKKTGDEGVSKGSSELATPETLNPPLEAVLDKKADLEEKKQVVPSSHISLSCDHVSSKVSVSTEEVTGPSPAVISEGKIENEAVNKDGADLVTPEPLNHPTEELGEKADLAETVEVLPTADVSASRDHFSSVVGLLTEDVTGPSPVVIREEKRTELEAVHKDSADLVTLQHLNHPAESVYDGKEEKKEVLLSGDNCASVDQFSSAESLLNKEVTGPSLVVMSEEKKTEDKGEAVNKDSADLVTHEALNHPAEAVSDEKADIEENKEVLPSSDSSASHDLFDGVSTMSHEETKTSRGVVEPPEVSPNTNCEGPQNPQVDGIDIDVEQVHLVNASAGAEPLDSGTKEDDRATNDGDGGIDRRSVDEKEKFAVEKEDSILESHALVSDVQDASLGSLSELDDVKLGSDDQIAGVAHAGPESIYDGSFVTERGEAIGNDECLKDDGDLDTHKAHENQVFSNESDQLANGGDTADKDKCLSAEIQNDKENNETNTTSMSGPSDKEIMQADSDMRSDQPVSATMLGAEIDSQDAVISQPEAMDSGGPSEKGGEINPEIPALDSIENMHTQDQVACSKVGGKDFKVMEDDIVCDNPIVNSEGCNNVVEEFGSPQSTKQELSVQITESSNDEVDQIGNNNLMPNEVTNIAAVSDTTGKAELPDAGDIKEKPDCGMASSSNEAYKSTEEDHEPRESNGFCTVDGQTSDTKIMDVEEERESPRAYRGESEVDAELGSEGTSSETEKSKLSNEEKVRYPSSLRMEQSGYLTPPENVGGFAQSDLVWGKVRSHPWWPGQIFDPEDASEKALKYHKKDSYLVAYFGDQTFAWNDSSALKPFRSYFYQIEKQSNSESFHNAVSCALEEVERRIELGLTCSCIPKDAYAKIEIQVVENTGICEEASRRHGVDQSSQASHFEPDKLLDYITGLAPRASSRADRLDLVIARAQLSAYCRFKGYRSPTEFPSPGELLENDADTEKVSDEMAASKKRRLIPKDGSQSSKERSSTELIGDREYSTDTEDEFVAEEIGKSVSLSSGKKRKAVDHPVEGLDKRVSVHAAKASTPASQTPKPSFKIGECIRRVASQLTGSTSTIKGSNDETVIDSSANEQTEKQIVVVPTESLSVNEMLSQLELLAQDPKKRHNIQSNIRAFFLGFRSSIVLNRRGRKKKSEQAKGGSGEEFEFDDVNDSYWTDRIVQNYSEEQMLHDSEHADKNLHLVPFGAQKPMKAGRKAHSRKRFSSGVSPSAANEEDENAKRRKQDSSPAELILNFAERKRVPSEINLNKMFRRFGPLMESETEVDHESGCAKVIFKRGADAEVAQNSAEKFNIFGPVLVDYQIGYSPVISVKILPVGISQPQEDASMML